MVWSTWRIYIIKKINFANRWLIYRMIYKLKKLIFQNINLQFWGAIPLYRYKKWGCKSRFTLCNMGFWTYSTPPVFSFFGGLNIVFFDDFLSFFSLFLLLINHYLLIYPNSVLFLFSKKFRDKRKLKFTT